MFVDSDDDLEPIVQTGEILIPVAPRLPEERGEEILIPVAPLEQDEKVYFLPVVEEGDSSSSGNFPPASFLQRNPRGVSHLPNIAQRSAIDAGCNDEEIVVDVLADLLPSQLEIAMKKMDGNDRSRMQEQIKKESIIPWDSRAIYTGLGVDENGKYIGLSIIRLNHLLCNLNEHLLLMRRDVVQHKNAIIEARAKDTLDSLGFIVSENRSQLRKVCQSITKGCKDLAIHIGKLSDEIEGKEENFMEPKRLIAAGLLLGSSVGAVIVAFFFHNKK